MIQQKSLSRKIFLTANYAFLAVVAFLCLLPLVNVLAISFSSSAAAAANQVKLWPVQFTLSSYQYVLQHKEFGLAFLVSLERVALGVPMNMLMTLLVAYPLSKEKKVFRQRGFFTWYFLITILFGGGLIPWYMTIKATGLLDSIWALVLPGALPVFNVILLLNFFRGLPKEIEEAAFIDGAGHWQALAKIYLPLSLPAMATLTLFCLVGHWNSWFDGLILMNLPEKYPLQSYLQTIIVRFDPNTLSKMASDQVKMLGEINDRTSKAAQLFVASVPILAVYPFLQKYFMTGIVLGSVKG